MKKIISLFQRDYAGNRLVFDAIVPGAEWVANGEGVATLKLDGTCCMVLGGRLHKRYELKSGRVAPEGFVPAQSPDQVTGDVPGWLLVGSGPEDTAHREAFSSSAEWGDGTYELCGPKVQGNPEGFPRHVLVRHGESVLSDCPRTFNELRAYLSDGSIEGIVWHHPDGRMVKIKGRDFGIKRRPKTTDSATPPQP